MQNNSSAFPSLPRCTLVQAAEQGAVLVTANRRLARALKREFDAAQQAAGRQAWATPDILPWSAWLERFHDVSVHAASGDPLPRLLSPLQEQALWERIVGESEAGAALLQAPATSVLCREAWALAHDWELIPALRSYPLSDDGRAFLAWADRYRAECRRLDATDGARLAALIAESMTEERIQVPARIVACGFDRLTPAQARLLSALKKRGAEVSLLEPLQGGAQAVRVSFPAMEQEIVAAAGWARFRLEARPQARIGIVAPDLAATKSRILRAFGAVMTPAAGLPGAAAAAPPFNISLGLPLSNYPLVDTALGILELAGGALAFHAASRLIRSPFLAGAEAEMSRRALFDARLREIGEPELTLEMACALAAQADENGAPLASSAPSLAARLAALREFRAQQLTGRKAPSAWSRLFIDALRLMGFPGERTLSSGEFQTFTRWRELLSALASLDAVSLRLDYAAALSRLRHLASDTVFQPETPEVSIQILGVLEAAGLQFDHLWVMGLTGEAWPPSPRPNPFLPIPLQRKLALPHASAEQELDFARRMTAGWLCAAPEVVLSHPLRQDDRDLAASPLIANMPCAPFTDLGIPARERYRDAIQRASRLAQLEDCAATRLPPGAFVPGGTAVFRDQAACPFRAFAAHRLGAASLQGPRTGLDPADRGILLHDTLARVWSRIETRANLEALDQETLEELVEAAAAHAVGRLKKYRPTTLEGRFPALEKARLKRLILEWLKVELTRGEFQVAAIEEKRALALGGLTIHAKLDRMDRLADGRRLVIDYKTGKVSVSHWLGPRPDEPQLPLYCVTAEGEMAAVAFAGVKLGGMRYHGLARDGDILPGVKGFVDSKEAAPYGAWNGLLAAWREELERLGREFAAGHAAVDPKRYPQTCRYCDFKPLCRINERLNLGPVEAEEGETDD